MRYVVARSCTWPNREPTQPDVHEYDEKVLHVEGNYNLCIDRGDEVVAIREERDWSEVVSGTTIVMRVIIPSSPVKNEYPCPRCGKRNHATRNGPSID